MLRPAHGITDGCSLVGSRSRTERFRRLQKNFLRDSAEALHHLRRVAGKVPLQNLEDALWIFEGKIPIKVGDFLGFAASVLAVSAARVGMPGRTPAGLLLGRTAVQPGLGIILLLLRVPT